MKPLGFNARHQHAGCACCKKSEQVIKRRAGKHRDRQQAKRAIAAQLPRGASR